MRAVWAGSVVGRRPAGAHAGGERCPGWRSLPDAEQSARDAAGHALDGGAGRPRVEDASHYVLGLALVPAPEGATDDLLAVLFATSGALYPTLYQTRALTSPRRCGRREWLGPVQWLLTGSAPTPRLRTCQSCVHGRAPLPSRRFGRQGWLGPLLDGAALAAICKRTRLAAAGTCAQSVQALDIRTAIS